MIFKTFSAIIDETWSSFSTHEYLPEALDLVIEHLLHDFLQFLDIHET